MNRKNLWRAALALFAALVPLGGALAQGRGPGTSTLTEDFAAGAGRWETIGGEWTAAEGRYTGSTADGSATGFALHRHAPFSETQTVEATVSVRRRLAPNGWSLGGIVLFLDSENYWLLCLTEDATGRRYLDFLENCRGVWRAESEGGTRLTPISRRTSQFSWNHDSAYRLRLQLTREGITARVSDPATGSELASAGYQFGNAQAVRLGAAGLMVRGCAMAFDDVSVSAPNEVAPGGIPVEKGTHGSVAILRDSLPGTDLATVDYLARSLRAAGFGVTPLTAAQAANPGVLNPQLFSLYVIPNAAVYPANGSQALMLYLRRSGNVMVLGGPAFTRPVWQHRGEWLDQEMVRARLAKQSTEHVLFDFEGAVSEWSRSTSDAAVPSVASKDAGGAAGTGSALKVWTENLGSWNTFASPILPDMFPEGHRLLCFWAKGDAQTPQMAVEMNEKDGARWMAVVPLTTEWTYHVLSPEDFSYWRDSKSGSARGGSGDRFNPRAAERVVFGLASSHTPMVRGGVHSFWVDQIGTAANPFAAVNDAGQEPMPAMESIHPAYKTYPLKNVAAVTSTPGQCILSASFKLPGSAAAFSAVHRPMGKGYDNGRLWRWIPLAQAVDASGERRGTPIWMLINHVPPYRDAVYTAFAINDQALYRSEPLAGAVVAVARRMRQGSFLTEAGARQFSWWPGEKVELGATVAQWGRDKAALTVRYTIAAKKDGKRLFSHQEAVTVDPGDSRSVTCAWNPAGHDGGECVVTTELLRGEAVIDRITHEIGFLNAAKPKPEAFVTVKDGDFWVNGRKWYPVGVNYWPLYVTGLEPGNYNRGGFTRAYYDPEEVERDLQLMAKLGINMVSIQLGALENQRNMADFMRRCARHGIRVNGFLHSASPVAFNEQATADMIRAERLDQNPVLFAYDIIWEPGNRMFDTNGRKRWAGEWEAWVVERYGSIANAEADWGLSVARVDGKIAPPTDQQMREDGPWRVMVAAYRRFMDDLMSRKWNDAVRRIRALDPNHLVSYRQGNTLPHDFALTATSKHIDFICPEGYAIPPGEKGYNAAGFITRYVNFTTAGKPIYWSEFGKSVWDSGRKRADEQGIAIQAEYNDLFYRTVLDAGAQGIAPWWWPGGYRVDERSDYGIINPDGTPRPSALLFMKYRERLHKARTAPKPETWFTVDRDAHPGGYWYLTFNTGSEAYRKARAEGKTLGIRSPGTGTNSQNTPLLAVGNRPYNGRNPLKYLNAEFNRLEVCDRDGKWVSVSNGAEVRVAAGKPVLARASLGNIQEATWLTPDSAGGKPGAVGLEAVAGSGLKFRKPIARDTPYLGDADLGEFVLTPGLTARTRVVLQMVAADRGHFGEKRDFTLVPTP